MNKNHTFFIKQAISATCLLICTTALYAAQVTIVVDENDPSDDEVLNLNLSTLLPIAEGNTWTYNRMKGTLPNPQSVTAEVGFRENVGGGCLALNPIVFGDDLSLYLANYEDSISLHGIYINRWKGLDDLVMKFETRRRVEWKDFENRYTTGPATNNSCQDTERGRVERTGLVLLEDLTENLGEVGNTFGEINCETKNSDLRSARFPLVSPIQTGSGTATIRGTAQTLDWSLDAFVLTPDYLVSGDLRIEMIFNPKIHSSDTDYSMFIDMTLSPRKGIISLQINDDAGYVMDEIHDLSYTLVDRDLVSNQNQVTPGGTCPDDSGSLSFLMIMMLIGVFPLRSINLNLRNS